LVAYEVISEVFKDRSRIFKSPPGKSETYQIKLKPIKIFEKPLDFKSLIPELNFIRNKKWTGHIQDKAMREIPKEDFELIPNRG